MHCLVQQANLRAKDNAESKLTMAEVLQLKTIMLLCLSSTLICPTEGNKIKYFKFAV
jgi:hypothetical protein